MSIEMKDLKPFLLSFYDEQIAGCISEKYNMHVDRALRLFFDSETYAMLCDDDLKMWYFSPLCLFDMWEVERITGDPRNSVYIRSE